ncbi:MAG: hypothetical protein QOH70_462 [Blastocatellia bacterium]|jgi:hypothetical protein|nr:hypothetical protein [Blastocatellia bacterium]
MRSRKQNPAETPRMSREETRTAFLFWLFWSAYLCLSVILVASLLTDWPAFLHSPNPYFFR